VRRQQARHGDVRSNNRREPPVPLRRLDPREAV
jgi:hypothetical protein